MEHPSFPVFIKQKQTGLDNKSIDNLMRMSLNNVTSVLEAVQQIVETWKRQCQRRTLSEDI